MNHITVIKAFNTAVEIYIAGGMPTFHAAFAKTLELRRLFNYLYECGLTNEDIKAALDHHQSK